MAESGKLLALQPGIVYGPVNSRRLGSSLGVNVLPTGAKACSFNCVYCQYGWANAQSPAAVDPVSFKLPRLQAVRDAVEDALCRMAMHNRLPDHLTLCGNGEPTLHPEFPEIVDALIELRRQYAPQTRLSILSNSSLVGRQSVREALARLDDRFMKLDCGTAERFAAYNKPANGITLELVVSGLQELSSGPGVVLQSLFADGVSGNCSPEDVTAWSDLVTLIQPAAVHIYTLDRGFPDTQLCRASNFQLEQIGGMLLDRGIRVKVFLS